VTLASPFCTEQASEAEQKIKETQNVREAFEEKREELNAKSRAAARAMADAREVEAQEARLAASAKAHEKLAQGEEQAAARVRGLKI
jgi:hypothetical protein